MSEKHAIKIIALDFDGTIVTNKYPEIGEPIEKNIKRIKEEIENGAKVILWTNRVNEYLDAAVSFCNDQGIRLEAVNENLPEVIEEFGGNPRKIVANEYWDDRAVWMSEYDIGTFSDGYHTFDDLYEQRLVLSAALFNVYKDKAWKSRKHSDGQPCFCGEYFIVGIDTPLGPYTYHYENCHWDMFNCKELDMAPEWDGHTDKDVHRLNSLGTEEYSPKDPEIACECKRPQKRKLFSQVMYCFCRFFRQKRNAIMYIFRPRKGMIGWAYHEVELACKNEREDSKVKDWDYGCYENALRAFRSLTKDGHSGFSIGLTQSILNRLIDGRPLTPIVDTPETWNDISGMSGLKRGEVNYQCKRMSSLFKCVYADGTIKYSDINSHYCVDISNKSTYHSGLVQKIIDEMYPITMPYWPTAPIKVYCQDLLTDRKNGDFDTVGIFYLIKPDGECVEINRFFKEGGKDWDEITAEEYEQRKKLKLKRLWEEKTDVPSFMKKEFHIPSEVELQDIASKEFDRSNTEAASKPEYKHSDDPKDIIGKADVAVCEDGIQVKVTNVENEAPEFMNKEFHIPKEVEKEEVKSKTCKGCFYDKENCTNPFECVKDTDGYYTRYKSISE